MTTKERDSILTCQRGQASSRGTEAAYQTVKCVAGSRIHSCSWGPLQSRSVMVRPTDSLPQWAVLSEIWASKGASDHD